MSAKCECGVWPKSLWAESVHQSYCPYRPGRVLSIAERRQLQAAIESDDTLGGTDRANLQGALDRTLNGASLPEDLTDLGDGRTDAERVAVALDYYYG